MCFLSKLLGKPIENPLKSENFPLFQDFELFKIFFRFRKIKYFFEKIFFKSKICPGIQKSYLENRASILKMFKIENPHFYPYFPLLFRHAGPSGDRGFSRLLSIFGVSLPTCSELISWTKKSDHQNFLFLEHVGGSIHQKKMFGTCCDPPTCLKIIGIFFVTDNSEIRYTPTWRA